MVFTKEVPYVQTPDYRVNPFIKNKLSRETYNRNKSDKDPSLRLSDEHILDIHKQFVAFREGLRELGFLPADANETDEISFTMSQTKAVRAVVYNIKTLDEYIKNFHYAESPWGGRYTSQTQFMLFEANLLRPLVVGFALSSSQIVNKAFLEISKYDKSFNRSEGTGFSYNDTLKLLKVIRKNIMDELEAHGTPATDTNMIRYMTIQRYVERGFSYLGKVPFPAYLNKYVHGVLQEDVELSHVLLALSPAVNKTQKAGDLPEMEPKFFGEFKGLPTDFIRRMLVPQTPSL